MTRKTLAPALATALAAAAVTLAPALPVRAQGIFIDPPGLDRGAPLMGVRANVAQQLRFYGLDGVDGLDGTDGPDGLRAVRDPPGLAGVAPSTGHPRHRVL